MILLSPLYKDKNVIMSYKKHWQKICHKVQKSFRMNEDKELQDPLNEDIAKTQEEATQEKALSEVEQLQEEVKAEKDKYLRLFAEFENFKKRSQKEKENYIFLANESLMLDLLPVLDDFERASKEIEKSGDENLVKGVSLIQNKLKETLGKKHLKAMEVNTGDAFNPDIHEAITQIPAPSEDLKGKIIDAVETGYTLGDKVIRYPKVVVGQ